MVTLINAQQFVPLPSWDDPPPPWTVDTDPHPYGKSKPLAPYAWSIEEAYKHGAFTPDSSEEKRWKRLAPDAPPGAFKGLCIFPPSHKILWTQRIARRYVESLIGSRPKGILIFFGTRFRPILRPDEWPGEVTLLTLPAMGQGNRIWNTPGLEAECRAKLQPVLSEHLS
jgi:hypothetical protein